MMVLVGTNSQYCRLHHTHSSCPINQPPSSSTHPLWLTPQCDMIATPGPKPYWLLRLLQKKALSQDIWPSTTFQRSIPPPTGPKHGSQIAAPAPARLMLQNQSMSSMSKCHFQRSSFRASAGKSWRNLRKPPPPANCTPKPSAAHVGNPHRQPQWPYRSCDYRNHRAASLTGLAGLAITPTIYLAANFRAHFLTCSCDCNVLLHPLSLLLHLPGASRHPALPAGAMGNSCHPLLPWHDGEPTHASPKHGWVVCHRNSWSSSRAAKPDSDAPCRSMGRQQAT